MIYRQKVLLALVEVFGGSLDKTDLQKLLFLFCKYCGTDHYEFFPHHYGAFSLLSYYDKWKLTQRKILADSDNFTIPSGKSFVGTLRAQDAVFLRSFEARTGSLRGEDLIRKTYLEHPKYAKRSTIAARLLSPDELGKTQKERCKSIEEGLFTIGYEGISIDGYLDRLIEKDIRLVIDVRKNPVSRKYGFSKNNLGKHLERVEIAYAHEPDLGVASHLRRSIQSPQDFDKLFEYYAVEVLPERRPELDKICEATKNYRRVALTCFEADAKMCHRHKITEAIDAITSKAIRISHI